MEITTAISYYWSLILNNSPIRLWQIFQRLWYYFDAKHPIKPLYYLYSL